jgi:hypothetical protein
MPGPWGRAAGFTPGERLSLLLHCNDHVVAICCGASLKYHELGADLILSRQNLCPQWGSDLTDGVHEHLRTCAKAAADSLRAQAADLRHDAQALEKWSREVRDRADVFCREAEAGQQERGPAREKKQE